jgi:hypothetical protein
MGIKQLSKKYFIMSERTLISGKFIDPASPLARVDWHALWLKVLSLTVLSIAS